MQGVNETLCYKFLRTSFLFSLDINYINYISDLGRIGDNDTHAGRCVRVD